VTSVSVTAVVAGRSGSPIWAQQEGRGATSVSVIVVVAGRSRSPFWAQQEGRGATSVSVIAVVLGRGGTKVLLHAQNSLALADCSVEITGLGNDRGLGEVTGLDATTRVLVKPRDWTAATGVLVKPRGWAAAGVLKKSRRGGSRALDESMESAAGLITKRSHGIGSRAHHETTVRRRSMNGGALSTPHLVLLHRELFVLCLYPSEKSVIILFQKEWLYTPTKGVFGKR
jgi:hypothetical protein